VLTAILLSRWGIVPLTASGGLEAIRLEESHGFDIVLMDIQMPDLDGFETTRRIREAQRLRPCPVTVPVVAYTACMLPLDAELMRLCGIDDALRKPCDPPQMSRCLQRWCAGKFSPTTRRSKNLVHA
jgi:CheY-like chemotaxis protein